MIEVPAAVELIEEITRVVDFISIGTNDLTQYTLAVDRNNVIVQDLFEKFHPALIRQLYRIISTAQKTGAKLSSVATWAPTPSPPLPPRLRTAPLQRGQCRHCQTQVPRRVLHP